MVAYPRGKCLTCSDRNAPHTCKGHTAAYTRGKCLTCSDRNAPHDCKGHTEAYPWDKCLLIPRINVLPATIGMFFIHI